MSGDQKYKGMMSYATIPEPCSGFVLTKDFQDAQKIFLHRDTVALILEGVNGSGKSEIAYKLVQDLELRERVAGRKVLPLLFNSSKRETLIKDLVNFCNVRNVRVMVESLANFKSIFESLNQTQFADSVKCLLFDDMVDNDEMEILNSTVLSSVESLSNGDCDKKDKWKFIVTTQPWDITCGKLPVDKLLATFSVKGYSQDEALQLFRKEQAEQVPEAKIKELHKLMQSPLGLSFAKQDLVGKGDEEYNSYIQALRKWAKEHLQDPKSYNTKGEKFTIASIVISLEAKLNAEPMFLSMLRIISFYHENNITHDMLIACMEICSPNSSYEEISSYVSNFLAALKKHLFQSVKITEEHGLQRLSIHQMVMTALRQLCHAKDSWEIKGQKQQSSNCRNALTALVRVMEFDGRFEENAEVNSYHVKHAETLHEFIKKKEREHPDFCDVTMKMMRAQILAAIGYIYLRGRNRIKKGHTMLLSARDELCSLINGYEDLVVTDMPEEDQASEIGVKLYEKMVQMVKRKHYEEHATYVPLYQRLTPRDWISLGLVHGDRKHLRDNGHLDKLRQDGKALPKDVMVSIYASELAASIFCTLARSASFHIEGQGTNKETVLKESKKNAQIALAVYNKIKEHHGIVILNKIIVQQEELHIRLELIETDPHNGKLNARHLEKVLEDTRGLKEQKDTAYEFGLRRSILREDNYHSILCNLILMRALGLLHQLEGDQHLQRANELFDDCVQRAQDKFKRNDCLSHVHQCWAKVLSVCEKQDEAVSEAIQSIRLLIEEGKADIIEKLKKGCFLELCKLVQTFVEKGGEPSGSDKHYIKTLADKCEQNWLKDRADILRYILKKTEDPRRKQLSAIYKPSEEDDTDGSPPIEVKPTTDQDILKLLYKDELYKISPVRGRALIINSIQNPKSLWFEPQKYCRRLKQLFEKMDFKAVVQRVEPPAETHSKALKKAEDLKKVISKETARGEHSDYGMFVLVLMSDGNETAITAPDGTDVPLTDFLDLLSSEKFPSMHGKPKIVFLQACARDTMASKAGFDALQFDSAQPEEPVVNHRDMAVVTSSFKGLKADGNTQMESWFITSLVDVFSQQSCHLEFYQLIMEVSNEVEEKCHKYNEGKPEKDQVEHSVIFRHGTLGKKLYFFPRNNTTSAAPLIQRNITQTPYKMSPEIHGQALIINMYFPRDVKPRLGSEKDCEKLLRLFNDMNFKSSLHTDDEKFKPYFPGEKNKVINTAEDLMTVIKEETNPEDEIKKAQLKDYDMFVLVLMSHGTENTIRAPDGNEVPLTKLLDLLSSEKFPSMHGKPKIVLIQACAGDGKGMTKVKKMKEFQQFVTDQNIDVTAGFKDKGVPSSNMASPHNKFNTAEFPKLVYHHRDIAVVTASFKGNRSARDPGGGSLFITSLVDVFREHAGNLEFYELIMKVGNKVEEKCVKEMLQEGYGQAVTFRYGTLRNSVFFPAAATAAATAAASTAAASTAAASNYLSNNP